jgi:hypothetical protein
MSHEIITARPISASFSRAASLTWSLNRGDKRCKQAGKPAALTAIRRLSEAPTGGVRRVYSILPAAKRQSRHAAQKFSHEEPVHPCPRRAARKLYAQVETD